MKRKLLFALRQRSDGAYEAVAWDQDKFIRLEIPETLIPQLKGELMQVVSARAICPSMPIFPE